MYKEIEYRYITGYAVLGGGTLRSPQASRRAHKRFQLDAVKIERAPKALRAKTETEIERAPDVRVSEHESNRLTLEVNERFPRSGGEIKDVFGKLDR
jgi:hypothetical protein